jgi:hypothetical protein
MLQLPTERAEVQTIAQSVTDDIVDYGNPEVVEDDIDISRKDEAEREKELAIRHNILEYEEALEKVDSMQEELNRLQRQQEDDDNNMTTHTDSDDYHESDDDIIIEDPYNNLEGEVESEEEPVARRELLGASVIGGRRRSHRIDSRRRIESKIAHAYRLTVKKALKRNEHASKASIMKELQQLVDKDVWEVIDKAGLSRQQLRKVIRSSMFLTEKFTASGVFDKLKSRLVAGGDRQDKSLYANLSSPTVAHETVMMVIAIAAIERRKVATIDITGAYLECDIGENDEVIMTIDPLLATLLSQIDPSVEQKRD